MMDKRLRILVTLVPPNSLMSKGGFHPNLNLVSQSCEFDPRPGDEGAKETP